MFYSFTDDTGVEHKFTNSYTLTYAGTYSAPCYVQSGADQRGAADQARSNYLKDLTARCDQFYSDQISVFDAAKKRVGATKGDPQPPPAPMVSYDSDTGWDNAWRGTGKYVRYAVAYVGPNKNVPDKRLLFSKWIQCSRASSYCPVVKLSIDSAGLATGRIVYRQLADDVSGTNSVITPVPIPKCRTDRVY